MTQNLWKFWNSPDLSDYSLIIPSVAVGNVGQLACDLLISSLDMKRIASVHSLALIPVLGSDPYDLNTNNLSSCCEAYVCTSRKLVVLQLRAPLVYKFARGFLEDVVQTFKDRHVKDIIILSSSFAHEMKFIQASPFRYVASETCPYKVKANAMKWVEHDLYNGEVKIFGGGFGSLLFEICKENEVPSLILYKYCSEGDNIPDAYDMIRYLADIKPLFSETLDLQLQLIQPVSWKLLFGRPPPQDIY